MPCIATISKRSELKNSLIHRLVLNKTLKYMLGQKTLPSSQVSKKKNLSTQQFFHEGYTPVTGKRSCLLSGTDFGPSVKKITEQCWPQLRNFRQVCNMPLKLKYMPSTKVESLKITSLPPPFFFFFKALPLANQKKHLFLQAGFQQSPHPHPLHYSLSFHLYAGHNLLNYKQHS